MHFINADALFLDTCFVLKDLLFNLELFKNKFEIDVNLIELIKKNNAASAMPFLCI